MIDISLRDGDIKIITSNKSNEKTYYDIEVEEVNISDILKRVLLTPLGYIRVSLIENQTLVFKDGEYGSELYNLLASPLNYNWSTKIKQVIEDTINSLNIVSLTITNIELAMPDLRTITAKLSYSYKNKNDSVIIEV